MSKAKSIKTHTVKVSKVKRNVKKKEVRGIMIIEELTPEKQFMAVDGSSIKSLKHLADALLTMSDDVYYYHVTQDRNVFARWVHDVFGEKELAEELGRVRHKLESQVAVLRHLFKKKT